MKDYLKLYRLYLWFLRQQIQPKLAPRRKIRLSLPQKECLNNEIPR